MGIFTGIGGVTPDATRYKKHIRSLERQRAQNMITNTQRAIDFREKEDPREQAYLKGSMWGRGLGKSSINDQETERLTMIQGQRKAKLSEAMTYANTYLKMIKRKHRWEKVSQYYQMIDGIIGLASGASNTSFGGDAGSGGASGGGGDYFGGGGAGGDYNFGGYS